MGNRIITEKDFWMCSGGAVPAPLQGSRDGVKTPDGEKYITIADTATSSCIDFGCTHYMLLAALVVAALAVIALLIVGTGGAALIVLGAVAGAAGALLMGVVGALICGHQMRGLRSWSNSKPNLILQSGNAITGNDIMTCPAGGTITFAPNITSWSQALGVAALKYTKIIVEGAFIGAGVATLAALATGSMLLALPTLSSIGTNVAIMIGMKILSGSSNLADQHALGRIQSGEDAARAFSPEYAAIQRIRSGGHVTLGDIVLFGSDILLPFLHVKAPTPTAAPLRPDAPSADAPSDEAPSDDASSGDAPPAEIPPAEAEIPDPPPGENGKAYEEGSEEGAGEEEGGKVEEEEVEEEEEEEEEEVPEKFSTAEEAAVAAMKRFNRLSIDQNVEYGGWIRQNPDGTFSYGEPTIGTIDELPLDPAGPNDVAWWHTHGAEDPAYDSENFSGEDGDIGVSRYYNRPGYVATPRGAIKVYDPATDAVTTLPDTTH